MALKQNFEVFSGNDITLEVTATDKDTGLALNLTGLQAMVFGIGKSATAQPFVSKTVGSGIEVAVPTSGVINITIAAADLEPYAGKFYHELRLTNSLGKKSTLMFGEIIVAANLIRT